MTNQSKQTLHATTRTETKKRVRKLREQGSVPCVMYGHKQANKNLTVNEKDLSAVYHATGESTLIDLVIDNKETVPVLIHDIARNYLTDDLSHVDFFAVNMRESIHAEVPLIFQGEAPAVKELDGVLVKSLDHIEVKCLPQDLVSELVVNISLLATFEDAIHISDLAIPSTLEVLDDMGLTVATVAPPRSEEELAKLNETVVEDVSKVEGAAETKPEEETAAKEGAAETKPEANAAPEEKENK